MKFLILFSLIVAVYGRYVDRQIDNRILNKCADGFAELADCVKYKTIKLLDRVIVNREPIPLANFLYLTHDDAAKNETEDLSRDEDALGGNEIGEDTLTELLMRRVRQLTTTKNLQIKLDTDVEQFEGKF